MKNYLVFKWDQHYLRGGFNDIERVFDTREEAEEYHDNNPLRYEESRQIICLSDCYQRTYRGE